MNQPKEKKKKNHLFNRMNLLFFVVFMLFSALIFRLGIVQIVEGEEYKRIVERTEEVIVGTSVPRGKMYDRNGRLVVDNKPLKAITYTKSQATDASEVLRVARVLATIIEKNTDRITDRDREDFLLLTEKITIGDKVPQEEQDSIMEDEKIENPDKVIYDLARERMTEAELNSISTSELEVLAIFREMNSGYALTPQAIKVGEGDDESTYVTDKEFAVVSEHLSLLPGVNTTMDWERVYPFEDILSSILGKVTTSKEGLPSEKLDYYTSRGYSRNDRVGKSFIELQYEDVLSGQKKQYRNITDKEGNVLRTEPVNEGKPGQDLVLTFDMELEEALDKMVEDELRKIKKAGVHPLTDRIFLAMMDPNTGEILAMVGKQWVDGEVIDYAMGTFTSAHEIGSAVKGATVLAGYMGDVLTPGERLLDEPITFKDTPTKNSWFNPYGGIGNKWMNERYALEKSSNSFMYKIALKLAGEGYYGAGNPLNVIPDDYLTLRYHYNQFGLGVKTGIDLPGEQTGFKISDPKALEDVPGGKLLDLAIGQFDTYTPMQMLQYVSTIANGGNRIAPKVVKEIRDPNVTSEGLGPVAHENSPTVLNRLDLTAAELNTVQEGFYRVFHGTEGTGRNFLNLDAAGKTGTAEVIYYGPNRSAWGTETENHSIVGYAPFDQPEVAFAVISPWGNINASNAWKQSNKKLAQRALEKYLELKEKNKK
ncbi:penicillin-binding transpeptidase domain-containing protein [Bacillus spongiae]|uniref:serine-type D-Ala-D-Ala carboxypeptidase n=1 Tax=Bacillus spongiae TaxID=2683610 RepID=A0ABU8H974_9BACI